MDIAVENLGAVSKFQGELPASGVYIFKGRNGTGKTTLVNAVSTAMGGGDAVPVRDNAERAKLMLGEVTMTVGARKSIKGELAVVGLAGRFSIADLVDPGINKPESADAARIKALVSIAQVEPSLEHFAGLVPGGLPELESLVSKPGKSDDLVAIAARVKRDLEAKARSAADAAAHAEGHAAGCREAVKGIDMGADCDAAALGKRLEAATNHATTLRAQQQERHRVIGAALVARKNLESSPAADVGAMDEEIQAAKDSLELHEAIELKASVALTAAKDEFRAASERTTQARQQLAGAKRLAEQVAARASTQAGWRASIEAAESVQQIPDSEVSAADMAVTIARGAVEQGAIIRRARAQDRDREGHEGTARDCRQISEELREAAKRTDEVLSGVVAKTGSPLWVEAGRLLLDTGRGPTLFAELSHGEKYRIAIDLAVDAVGAAGLLHLPQEAWEGLDPENRRAIHEHAVKRGVRIITAEADGGELRGEAYQP